MRDVTSSIVSIIIGKINNAPRVITIHHAICPPNNFSVNVKKKINPNKKGKSIIVSTDIS